MKTCMYCQYDYPEEFFVPRVTDVVDRTMHFDLICRHCAESLHEADGKVMREWLAV